MVFAGVAAAGFLTAKSDPPLPIAAAKAIAIGERDPTLAATVKTATDAKVLYIDDETVTVTWFRHGRGIATTAIKTDGTTFHPATYPHQRAGYGAPLAHDAAVLGALLVLFLLATLRGPLLRWRTLDVLVLAAFLVPTVLIDRAWLVGGEAAGAVLLLYVLARGVVTAVRGTGDAEDADAPVLLQRLAARWRTPALPVQIAGALLLATVLVTATSTGMVDVATANMEGATLLSHGVLPYGHMPGDVVHGDTYGLPIYLIYTPFAALWPVASDWDDAVGSLLVAALGMLACAAGIARAMGGGRVTGSRWPAIIALLAFPAALMSTSSGTNDGLIAAALIWTLAWWARPAASSALLAGAGVAKIAPLVLLPLWLARLRGAALLRAIAACAAVGVATVAALVACGGVHGPFDMVHAMTFQLSRRSMMSLWTTLGLQGWQPIAQALTLAVALGGAALVALDRDVARDPRRVAGLLTAVLAALQLQANHWAPLYLLWLAPPAMVALLGPLGAPAPVRVEDEETVPAPAGFAPV
ncbi:hypothetical protein DSM104299_01536 [Baekduia alba]|nr:hypothetical protein DSM104299_01536 [Baekduia alba]